jgi:hypothetical protein
LLSFLVVIACSGTEDPGTAPVATGPAAGAHASGPGGPPLPGGPGGPPGAPPGGPGGPGAPGGSGGAFQDPTGFPSFHDQQAPAGPEPGPAGAFSRAIPLAQRPAGGYRPQIATGPDGTLHAVYYDRVQAGDIIRYRQSTDGGATWSAPETVSFEEGRNWGPDIVVRPDGTVVIVFDQADAQFRSRGWLRERGAAGWGEIEALTPDGDREIGSGHVANAAGGDLAYVYIAKQLGEAFRFAATWRWRTAGVWSDAVAFTDGSEDAWHTNVERRPDGSVLAGWDVGNGGSETTLYVAEGKDGRFSAPENLTATSHPGERPHFAFAPGKDWVAWFHKQGGVPLHVYVRAGRPGAWGPTEELSAGVGGFQFDPDIAVNKDGVLCAVWGWDAGHEAELVYALNRGSGWDPPKRVANVGWGKPGLSSIDPDPSGTFHVVWNQGVRGSNEVYYASLRP